tara:strand:+ start:282 stop:434 length:153 start_codon:yes stop_codon:yes gene_type:complete
MPIIDNTATTGKERVAGEVRGCKQRLLENLKGSQSMHHAGLGFLNNGFNL